LSGAKECTEIRNTRRIDCKEIFSDGFVTFLVICEFLQGGKFLLGLGIESSKCFFKSSYRATIKSGYNFHHSIQIFQFLQKLNEEYGTEVNKG
jgi:hypothetical protein